MGVKNSLLIWEQESLSRLHKDWKFYCLLDYFYNKQFLVYTEYPAAFSNYASHQT